MLDSVVTKLNRKVPSRLAAKHDFLVNVGADRLKQHVRFGDISLGKTTVLIKVLDDVVFNP
jgi:hypothetical protein